MRFIAMSMVSWSGILVKRLVTSKEENFLERFAVLIWGTKEKRSLGTKGKRRSQRKRARL